MKIWSDEFEDAVTICDQNGIITYMNDTSKILFGKYGGGELVGTSLLDYHPEPSRLFSNFINQVLSRI